MAATMKDIATYTGLSVGTVSNYITGKMPVSEEKRMRIDEAIKILDYKVNFAARTLRTNSSKCIGILIPDFRNIFLVRVVSYIESYLYEKGYSMLVLSYKKNVDKEKELLQYLTQRVDGILYVPDGNDVDECVKEVQKTTPVVMFNEIIDSVSCDKVIVDNREIVKTAVDALHGKGHTKIGIIAGPSHAYTTLERMKGYRESLEKNGLAMDETLIAVGDYSRTSGEQLCGDLIDQHPDMTAVFVAGYRMTLGVLTALAKKGLQNKIAVIGYDAADIEYIFSPKVSYLYQPYDKVAEHAANLILKRVNHDVENFPMIVKLNGDIKNLDELMNV